MSDQTPPELNTCFWDQHGGITAIVERHDPICRLAGLRAMLWSTMGLDMDRIPADELRPIVETLGPITLRQVRDHRLASRLDLNLNEWHPLGDGPIEVLGYRLDDRNVLYDLDDRLTGS